MREYKYTNADGNRVMHKQVRITWGNRTTEVDEELGPLILALWKLGIDTVNSCQENRPGITWIEFLTPVDAAEFLDLVAVHPDEDPSYEETPYDRIVGFGEEGDWEYALHPQNWAVDEEVIDDEVIEHSTGPADFNFFVSIRFPKTDLPWILARVSEAVDLEYGERQEQEAGRKSNPA
jgi:hypothetical protein